jgi:group I intron endonuclease
MPEYELTKIYKITNDINDKIYIGSTTLQYLCNRLNVHKQHTKINTSRRNSPMNSEMKLLGVEHFKIELIEKFPCNNKKEMVEREQYYLELLKPQLNKFRAIKDPDYEKKRKIRDKDKIALRGKIYYNKNKDKIAEKAKLKFICECGTICGISDKNRHFKSIKHCEFIKVK